MDLFKWSIITAIITSILVYLLVSITTNNLYHWILFLVIVLTSTITFSRKYPQLASFKSGAVLGVVILATMGITNQTRGDIQELLTAVALFIIIFFIAGYIGKVSRPKFSE